MHVAGVYSLSLPKLQPAFFLCWTMSLLLQRQTHELVIKKITKLVEQHLMRFVKRAPRSEQDVYPSCLQNLLWSTEQNCGMAYTANGGRGPNNAHPPAFSVEAQLTHRSLSSLQITWSHCCVCCSPCCGSPARWCVSAGSASAGKTENASTRRWRRASITSEGRS